MSIDFSKIVGLSDSKGVITQITDSSGRVIWTVASDKIILEVEKITADTYAGETTYTGEEFILLNIYPKTNGIVNVTYGGLTKTITDTSGVAIPNAQKVFFGTFNGVSDDVVTPTSGELIIEGDCNSFGCGTFNNSKGITVYHPCVTAVNEWGNVTSIGNYAFNECTGLVSVTNIPDSVTSIGDHAFFKCSGLTSITIGNGVTSIGDYAFNACTSLALTSLPSGVTSIGNYAFNECANLTLTEIPEGVTSIGSKAFYMQDMGADTGKPNTKIQNIILPSTLEKVGIYAFSYFENYTMPYPPTYSVCYLNTMTIRATTPPICEDVDSASTNNGWLGADGLLYGYLKSIIVPKGCGEAYKTALGWSYYKNIIVEEE